MNPFESRIRNKIETAGGNNVDTLIAEFPEELHERLEDEISGMDDQEAEDYLIHKLIARKESLVEWSIEEVSKYVEITHDVPIAVLDSIEQSSQDDERNLLGSGMNGRVYQSVRKSYACYKVLYLERARAHQLSIVREAVLQHDMGELAKEVKNGAQIPEVIGFVEHPEVLAIMMKKVDGSSLIDIFEGKAELPADFDADAFFEKLEATVTYLNEHGYYHRDLIRDLTPNSGNVMVDKEGNPWLVDFGSAVKALNPDQDAQKYQLRPNGRYMMANDLSGVRALKDRVVGYLKRKEHQAA